MDVNEIKELIKLVDDAKLQEVEIEQADVKIKLKRQADVVQQQVVPQQQAQPQAPIVQAAPPSVNAPAPAQQQEATPAVESAATATIKSPMTGTFYAASSPENPPFVTVGQEIKEGQPVCIIEAMKLFNEIESEQGGTIEKILVKDGEPVELDQPLFLLKQ